MQYKGDDMDLRVPHGRPARDPYATDYEPAPGNGRWQRTPAFAAGPGEPLWVDEVLLACCNYAFDVAQANGSAEVGLEHLVNALTRVDSAARVLEARIRLNESDLAARFNHLQVDVSIDVGAR